MKRSSPAGVLQRRALLLPVRDQLVQRPRLQHRAGEDMRADLGALLQHADGDIAAASLGKLRSRIAAASPAGPPPTITTSNSIASRSFRPPDILVAPGSAIGMSRPAAYATELRGRDYSGPRQPQGADAGSARWTSGSPAALICGCSGGMSRRASTRRSAAAPVDRSAAPPARPRGAPPPAPPAEPAPAGRRPAVAARAARPPTPRQAAAPPAPPTWPSLRAAIAAFDGCAAEEDRDQTWSSPTATPKAGVMLIGEAPGEDEDRQGKPFVGACRPAARPDAGRDRARPRRGLHHQHPALAPARQPHADRAEIAAVLPFLERHIELVRPRHPGLLGGVAAKALLARRRASRGCAAAGLQS